MAVEKQELIAALARFAKGSGSSIRIKNLIEALKKREIQKTDYLKVIGLVMLLIQETDLAQMKDHHDDNLKTLTINYLNELNYLVENRKIILRVK